MYHFRRLVVGLDFSGADRPLLAHATFIARTVGAQEIRLVHIQEGDELPSETRARFPELPARFDAPALHDAFAGYIEGVAVPGAKVTHEVLVGEPVETFLRYVKTHDVDLLMLGRKPTEADRPSVVCRRLIWKVRCSLLFAPAAAAPRVERLLIPFDVEDYSQMALKGAFELAEQASVRVVCQILYHVPMGWTKSGKSYEEFAAVMRDQAEQKFEAFVRERFGTHPDFIETRYTLDDDRHPSADIYRLAHTENVDLVIVGSRGRGTGAALLLKDIAERLFACNDQVPLLIVKRKTDGMNVFQALLNL
ncbi:MAG: universal stress protein [Catalinimonas sp.]